MTAHRSPIGDRVSGRLEFGELAVEGYSRAGEETWFRIHPPGLALDAGRGHGALVGARDFFLTHGHLDHALGLPWVLSQRSLQGAESTRIFAPTAIRDDLASFLEATSRLERVRYRFDLLGLAAGDRVAVGGGLTVEAFSTDHVVPSLGFHLVRRRHHLAEPYRGLGGAELAALRSRGVAIEIESEEVWLSYAGDTGPGVFSMAPRLGASRVLFLECTFVGDKARDRGALYGHLHIDDLAAHAEALAGVEAIVLHHLSRRHRREDLVAEIERLLPALAPRIHLFPGGLA